MTVTPDDIRKAREIAWKVQGPELRKNRPCPEDVSLIAQALRAEREAEREWVRKLAIEAGKRLPEEQRANGDFCHEAIDQAIRRSEP